MPQNNPPPSFKENLSYVHGNISRYFLNYYSSKLNYQKFFNLKARHSKTVSNSMLAYSILSHVKCLWLCSFILYLRLYYFLKGI